LELEFLQRVEWRIVPQPEVLVDYYRSLVERCDEYEIQQNCDPDAAGSASDNSPLIDGGHDQNGLSVGIGA